MKQRAFVVLGMVILAAIIVGGVIVLDRQARSVESLDQRIAILRIENSALLAKNAVLLSEISELRTKLEIIASSKRGYCHPGVVRMIEEAWEQSHRAVPLRVLKNMVWVESRCIPWAVSHRAAVGLLQVKAQAAEDVGYEHSAMLLPDANLGAGLEYLEMLLRQSGGDIEEALTRFHWGSNRYENGVTTMEYSRRILNQQPD